MSAHTAGPWRIGAQRDRIIADDTKYPDANPIAHVYDRSGLDANVRLIAAAPDMLQALREVLATAYVIEMEGLLPSCIVCSEPEGKPHDPDCTMHFVIAAIAKAEGS